MVTLQRMMAGLTVLAFTSVVVPGPALAGGYREAFGERYSNNRIVQAEEYDPWSSRSRYSDDEQGEEESDRSASSSQAMKAVGALVVLGLLFAAMSGGSSGSSGYSSDDAYAQRRIDREYQAQEEARQERQADEARQQQQNCYGGCAW
jgi:hypothetical protein